jgi:hypothetical protein
MEGQNDFTAQIMQAECQLSGISITGEVTGGFIRLLTRWFRATLHIAAAPGMETKYSIKFPFATTHSAYGTPISCGSFLADVPLITESASPPRKANNFSEVTVRRSTFFPEHTHLLISGIVSCVLISTLDSGDVAFMVLDRAPSQIGAFGRLGIFRIGRQFLTEA